MNMKRENGFYWIRMFHLGWVVAEYRSDEDSWHLTNGEIYQDRYIDEVDENLLVKE